MNVIFCAKYELIAKFSLIETQLSDEMISRVPVEANVIISGGDQHDIESSTSPNDVLVVSSTNEIKPGKKASINGEAKEVETSIIDFDEDNPNETLIDFSHNEQDEIQHLLRKEGPSAKLNKSYGTLKHNETLNKFLQDIYEREIDLNVRFSNNEVNDIRDAVETLVNKLALKVGEVDSRFKIADVILLGSARERSQIVRPCEYDFALSLENLSLPDVVSIQLADQNDNSREYVHVKLKDSHIKSAFRDVIDDKNTLLCNHWLPWFRRSLRKLLYGTIKTALQATKYEVIMDSGVLSFKHYDVKEHGPAFTISLIWERVNHIGKVMGISVDLCPSLKLSDVLDHLLPQGHDICPAYLNFVQRTGSVLLMPREGFRFKVSFTESELLRTERMSEHHKKCYKILKYLLNGEPFPYEKSQNALVEFFRSSQTIIHSYALKTLIWDHHYVHRCCEENDLGSCITQMLTKMYHSLFEGLVHPVHSGKIVQATMETVESLMVPTKSFPCTKRIEILLKGLEKVSTKSIQEYNYKARNGLIATSGFLKGYAKLMKFSYFIFSFVMYVITLTKFLPDIGNATFVAGSFVVVLSLVTLWCPFYMRSRVLAFVSMYNISEYRISLFLVCSFSITHIAGWVCYLNLIGNAVVSFLHAFMALMLFFSGNFLMFSNITALRRHVKKGHGYVMLILTFMTFVGFMVYLVSVISMPRPFWH